MNKLILFIFTFVHACCPAYGATPVVGYPTATSIRFLKQNLDLNGQASVLSGTVDPTVTATTAPIGSLYLNTSTGTVYRKADAGSTTNWSVLSPLPNYLTNLLVDGSFEGVTLNSAWVPQSGTMTPTVATTDYVDGKRAVSFSSGGASVSGNLLVQTVTTLPNTDGLAIDLTASFKTTASNLQLCLGQAGTTLTCQAIPGTGKWVTVSLTAPMPTAAANFYVSTTAAGIVDFKIDNAYMGLSQNVGSSAQATIYATASQAGALNCSYTVTPTANESAYVDMGAAASCASPWTTTGNITAVGATSSSQTLSNMPYGDYEVTVVGTFATSTNGQLCNFQISDGTNSFGYGETYSSTAAAAQPTLTGRISYSGTASRTFKIITSSSSANACRIDNNAVGRKFEWTFKRFPTQSEQVVRLSNQPVYAGKTWLNGSFNHGQGVAGPTTRTVASATGFATYTQFGSVVNDASQNVQVTANLPIGEYEITTTGLFRAIAPSGAANSGSACNFDIYDSTAGNTVGGVLVAAPDSTTSTAAPDDLSIIKTYVKITTAGTKTYQLRVSKVGGANASYCQFYADNTTTGFLYNASMMIRPLNQNVNVVIPGSLIASPTVQSGGVGGVSTFEVGQWTPSWNNLQQVTSLTLGQGAWNYIRTANAFTAWGSFDIQPSTASSTFGADITLPSFVTNTFQFGADCSGSAYQNGGDFARAGRIRAGSLANAQVGLVVNFQGKTGTNLANDTEYFHFSCRIR